METRSLLALKRALYQQSDQRTMEIRGTTATLPCGRPLAGRPHRVYVKQMQYLPFIKLVCFFVFGSAMAGAAIVGMRSGRFWCKYGRLTKDEDGPFFWVVTVTVLLAGCTVVAGTIWIALTHNVFPRSP